MAPLVGLSAVSPDYFQTLQAPILQGRSFTESDTQTSVPVAIVNQAFVTNFLHGEDPLNKRIIGSGSGNSRLLTIVGVAADIHHSGLEQNVSPQIYRPYNHPYLKSIYRMALLLRSRTDPATLAAAGRRKVAALHGGQPLFDVATMNQILQGSLAQRRLSLNLVGTFSVLLFCRPQWAFMESRHTRWHSGRMRLEFAWEWDAVRHACWNCIEWIGVDHPCRAVAGLAAALWLSRFITSLLYRTQPNDLASMLSASTLLVGAGLLAGAIPDYRASKVDPVIALRAE
jgi:putative ABC transport system permease protein